MNNSLALSLSQASSKTYKTRLLLKRIICIYFVAFFVFVAASIIIANAAVTGLGIFFKRIFSGFPPELNEGDTVTEEHLQMLEWHERLAYYCLHVGQRPATMLGSGFFYDTEGSLASLQQQLIDKEISDDDYATAVVGVSHQQTSFYFSWKTVADIYKALQAIGLALCIAYAVMYIVDSASADRVSPEQIIKVAIRMLISVLIILNGMRILEGLIGLANIIMRAVTIATEHGDLDATIYNAVRTMEFGQSLNACIEGLANFIRNGLVALVGLIGVYGRTIQICVLGAFAPIGFADSYNGMNSGAVRYAKRFFAALLQGALVIAVISIVAAMRTGLVVGADTMGGITSIIHIIVTFAGISAISSTKKWSEQIVGAM